MAVFNKELAAQVLIECVYNGDQKTVVKYGISERSLQNWRKRLQKDVDFAALFAMKKRDFDAAWVDRLAVPIQKAMDFITEACRSMDQRQKSNPEMIHAVAGALKICAEVYLTSRMLNAGDAPQDQETSGASEQVSGAPLASKYRQ